MGGQLSRGGGVVESCHEVGRHNFMRFFKKSKIGIVQIILR